MSTLNVESISHPTPGSNVTVNGITPASTNSLGPRNLVINGDMRIDQRNAGSLITPTSGQFPVDRFNVGLSQTSKITTQQVLDGPNNFKNSVKVTVSSAYTPFAADYFVFEQDIEGLNTAHLNFGSSAAQTVTLSFWVKSSLTGTFAVSLRNAGYNRSQPKEYTVSAANTWEYKTITYTGDTTGTWATDNTQGVRVSFSLGAGSDFHGTADTWQATNDYATSSSTDVVATNGATWQITGVQLEVGSVATPFEHRSYGDELARCQRYYETYSTNDNNRPIAAFYSTTNANCYIPFKVTKRSAPTVAVPTLGNIWNGGWKTVSSASATPSGSTGDIEGASFVLVANVAGSAGYAGFARNNNFTFDSEL